ncbi:hypothetical protein D3C76_1646240 [compost metagenome]
MQVEHLRDEQLTGAWHHLADPGPNLAQKPLIELPFAKLGGQFALDVIGLIGRHPQLGAFGRDANGDQAVITHDAVGVFRQFKAEAFQGLIA